MVEFISIKGWNRGRWLKFREGGIGGSEVCASISDILGDKGSKNSDPIKIHLNKIQEPVTTFAGNRFSKYGVLREPGIADQYQYWDFGNPDCEIMLDNQIAGNKLNYVRTQDCYIINSKYPWLLASIDRRILRNRKSKRLLARKRGILECKNTTSMEKNRYQYGISPDFYFQVYTYLMLTEWEYADVAIHFDGNNFEVITLEPRKDIFEFIEHHTANFWKNVLKCLKIKLEYNIDTYYGVPDYYHEPEQMEGIAKLQALEPELLGTESEAKFLREIIKPTEEYTEMMGNDELWGLAVVERPKISEQKKAIDGELRLVNNKIIRELSGTHVANYDGGVVSYKPDSRGISKIHVSKALYTTHE